MDLGPCLHEPPLSSREVSADQFDWVEREDPNIVLVVRMQVGPVVWPCRFSEHADDDSK